MILQPQMKYDQKKTNNGQCGDRSVKILLTCIKKHKIKTGNENPKKKTIWQTREKN